MTAESNSTKPESQKRKVHTQQAASAPIYGFGVIGALVYYIGHATTFWLGVLGVFKAIAWPAMLVYEILKYFQM